MAVTSVAPDRDFYSRYESGCNTIVARIRHTYVSDTPVTITLERNRLSAATQPGWTAVGTVQTTLLAGTPAQVVAAFALESVVDAYGLHAAPAGEYRLSTSDGAVSRTFRIGIVTPGFLRDKYFRGYPLQSQALEVTGLPQFAQAVRISDNWDRAVYTLAYTNSGRTLSIAGGPAVAIPAGDGPHQVTLVDAYGAGTLALRIDGWFLPQSDASYQVTVDYSTVTDADIADAIDDAMARLELYLGLDLEVRRYSTAVLAGIEPSVPVDRLVDGVMSEPIHNRTAIWSFGLRRPMLQQVERITGFLVGQRMAEIPLTWVVNHSKAGRVDLLPLTGEMIMMSVGGNRWLPFIARHEEMPNFWHTRFLCGLRDLWEGPAATAREALQQIAVLQLMGIHMVSVTGGRAAISVSRDGVSQSLQYNQGGPYAPYVQDTQQFLAQTLPQLRQRLVGFTMVNIG